MAFKPKSAAETKARDLGLALARIAEGDGTPASIGIDQLRRVSPRLTPLAIGQMVRKERAIVEETLAERGLALVDYADQGPGRGMEFVIDAAG
ncbi:adenylosuccinate synthase [Methylobacterium sp. J-048]|uniref:adenylosuccinate synthase n=1 Tax=Methylobacterium sp. J-048 TaxID=2836635 RepID=UPI001FB97E64|nr:adenylosuccinate synthase [Methylobacterium sp. J-048]MCJ2059891.1 adenylosuccinate synthase [Methylobacterium sp. J-048]